MPVDTSETVRFVPLGGLGEIGMNCMAVETGGRRIVLDCGLAFDGRNLGVDTLHADFGYVLDEPERLEAIVLTHGHEDHIGAVPHLLAARAVPVYGPPYALSLLKEKLAWDGPPGLEADLRPIRPGEAFTAGPFEIEPFRVTHSMPDCTGLIFRTPAGVVVHSGDFKIEEAPTDGEGFDFDRLARLRDEEGVRLLFSDSTNSVTDGTTGTEAEAHASLEPLIREAEGRVVVTLFASNVHRLRALTEIAKVTGRKLCLLGRSLQMHARLGALHGYLDGLDAVRVPRDKARALPREKVLVLATGTQGEPPAAFARLANGTHPDLELEPGDRVIHSARIIPGNEKEVHHLINALERRGVEVIWKRIAPGIHVSGHAHRDEQRRLIELLRPRSFVPVHGTYLHLRRHGEIAEACGVEDVLVVENGAVVELSPERMEVVGAAATGRVYRERGQEISERVIKDRALLAELGVAMVSVVVDDRGRPLGPVDILTRGVLHEDENEDMLDDACDYVFEALTRSRRVQERPDDETLEIEAKRALKRFFAKSLGRKPLCYGVILRVDA